MQSGTPPHRNFLVYSAARLADEQKEEAVVIQVDSELALLRRELEAAREQQAASADVFKVISRSTFDIQAVLEALSQSVTRLCGADFTSITQRDGETYYEVASYGYSVEFKDYIKNYAYKPGRGTAVGRTMLEGKPVHIVDVLADAEYEMLEGQRLGSYRTVLGVPLLREGVPIGVIVLCRSLVSPFTSKQIDLVTTFADQAVIAIENTRLFEEVQTRTRELAESLDDLRATQDRLVETQKLASLGQLTAGIAHEIKNPLNFVNNFAELSNELIDELEQAHRTGSSALDDKIRDDVEDICATLKDNLDKIVQHGRRADTIVKNMLLHSREGAEERRSVGLNALVEEALNFAYHGARAEKPSFNINLEKTLDPAVDQVAVYPQELTRALLNLISNGFHAAHQKNGNLPAGFQPTLSVSTRAAGRRVKIKIRDNGFGIPDAVRTHIFEPFFTTKPPGEGTGLGLSISHDIVVKQHGGAIDLATQHGEFTEFTITLPRGRSS